MKNEKYIYLYGEPHSNYRNTSHRVTVYIPLVTVIVERKNYNEIKNEEKILD